MSTKRLVVDFEKCSGCRLCMVDCSIEKSGRIQPSKARLFVVKHDKDALDIPIVCHQCEICTKVCPEDAITLNDFGAKVVNPDLCTSCGLCEDSCPYGTIWVDYDVGSAVKCDLCTGDPRCIQICPYNVLALKSSNEIVLDKRIKESERIVKLIRKSIPYNHESGDRQ